MEQRNLPDAVAIQYAIRAMGDTLRGIFPAGQTLPNCGEFVKELKPTFMPHRADGFRTVPLSGTGVQTVP